MTFEVRYNDESGVGVIARKLNDVDVNMMVKEFILTADSNLHKVEEAEAGKQAKTTLLPALNDPKDPQSINTEYRQGFSAIEDNLNTNSAIGYDI